MDGRLLHGRGRRQPGFPPGEDPGLSGPSRLRCADRSSHRGDDRVSGGAGRGRSGGGAALRQLGRRPAGAGFRALGHRADTARRRGRDRHLGSACLCPYAAATVRRCSGESRSGPAAGRGRAARGGGGRNPARSGRRSLCVQSRAWRAAGNPAGKRRRAGPAACRRAVRGAMRKTAVVLMNLGGPDSLAAVEPFLRNLFADPAIMPLPPPLRKPLARLIAAYRASLGRNNYARLGGASPLLANTEAQARALESALGPGYRSFIAMRYWHPTSAEAARAVREWAPDQIVCLPLYPQFSTTTTASSFAAWKEAAADQRLHCPTRIVCCYPREKGFVEAIAALTRPALEAAAQTRPPRLLLTAHGLPKRVVAAGDPYRAQVEMTAQAIVAALELPGLDWRLCFQSRVGPLAWLEPSTEEEIRRAGRERTPLVVAPISFVSEHSETLIELDQDYRRLAGECGVPCYRRVPTVGTEPAFIAALARLVHRAAAGSGPVPGEPSRVCGPAHAGCALAGTGR